MCVEVASRFDSTAVLFGFPKRRDWASRNSVIIRSTRLTLGDGVVIHTHRALYLVSSSRPVLI
jgi:hypothetical protein